MTRRRLLVANRGEIARRIIRTARTLGWETVAVYTDADAQAPHVSDADRSIGLGAPRAYLDAAALVDAAGRSNATAVHPGYGFLAENAGFARACDEAGLTFVGPPAAVIEAMGDKAAARRLATDADVRCVPGHNGPFDSAESVRAAADALGFPLMIKAVAGGGGRGLRRVDDPLAFADALAAARNEAISAFGDDGVILERLIAPARHLEVQIVADGDGHCIHLGERDCSVQRRHQKLVEESPAPGLGSALRRELGDAAVRVARACGYVGAGTVEFLVDEAGDFFFLEMNTRLQVEHPVTELVTGLDLVALQLEIAEGAPLALTQADLAVRGHAIEARLYAEDPARGFLPRSGRVLAWRPPAGTGLRVDGGVETGTWVPPDYDTLTAKIIAHGRDRDMARRRLMAGLRESRLLGLAHNKSLLLEILGSEDFAAGPVTVGWLDSRVEALAAPGDRRPALAAAAVLATTWTDHGVGVPPGWTNGPGLPLRLDLADEVGEPLRIDVRVRPAGLKVVENAGGADATFMTVSRVVRGEEELTFELDGTPQRVAWAPTVEGWWLDDGSGVHGIMRAAASEPGAGTADPGQIRAPMDGEVTAVAVAQGDRVEAGDLLVVLEAMKIEHRLRAPVAGRIAVLHAAQGDRCSLGAELVQIDPEDSTP